MKPTTEDLRVASELVEHFIVEHFLPQDTRRLADQIASAIASEREKAAKVADRFQVEGEMMPTLRAQNLTAVAIAAAIRANKE